ncbi:unnamed protein product, partial [Urochloa humidicola]
VCTHAPLPLLLFSATIVGLNVPFSELVRTWELQISTTYYGERRGSVFMASTSQPAAIGKREEERKEEKDVPSEASNVSQLVIPEDGYEWKKYGQKFIKNIQKNRRYFRCRHKLCGVKKRVEWHPNDPAGDLRIVYEGAHQHGSDAAPPSAQRADGGGGGAAASASNQYELGAQYFGGARSN